MSAYRAIVVVCDKCGLDRSADPNHDVNPTIPTFRAALKELGWKTGLLPTVENPSLYEVRCDICPDCQLQESAK